MQKPAGAHLWLNVFVIATIALVIFSSVGRANRQSAQPTVANPASRTITTTSSAELYDPATGQWTPTGNMTTAGFAHSATLLSDGKVLVAGGQRTGGNAFDSTELYDPATGVWTATGKMNTRRSGHAAQPITSGPLFGMVLVAGGYRDSGGADTLDTAELYDPSTGLWAYTGIMSIARYWIPTAPTSLADGSVLVVGGTNCCPYHWFNEAEIHNPITHTWTPTTAKMSKANEETVVLPNGVVLVAGRVSGTQGATEKVAAADLFDPATGAWTATAKMSIDRYDHTLTPLGNGHALVAGGCAGGWGTCTELTRAELYDPSTGTWFPTGNMVAGRDLHTATLLPNGQVLAAGGRDFRAGTILSSAELYTPGDTGNLSLVSATSSKKHGNAGVFNVDLPLTGTPGVECRQGALGTATSIVFTFSGTVNSVDRTSTSCGTIISTTANGSAVTVLLNNIQTTCDGSNVTVTLTGVSGDSGTLASAAVTFGMLAGDVNGDRTVDGNDLHSVRMSSGRGLVTDANFRNDVSGDGKVNHADIKLTRDAQGNDRSK